MMALRTKKATNVLKIDMLLHILILCNLKTMCGVCLLPMNKSNFIKLPYSGNVSVGKLSMIHRTKTKYLQIIGLALKVKVPQIIL